MSMEPVAYTTQIWLDQINDGVMSTIGPKGTYQYEVPLVRLSDAEASIAELEAKLELLELEAEGHDNGKRDLAEVLNCSDEPRWKYMRHEAVKLKARADAAEALLKETKTMAEIAIAAEKMMNGAAVLFSAYGEPEDAKKLTKAATIIGERARALKSKIGGKG